MKTPNMFEFVILEQTILNLSNVYFTFDLICLIQNNYYLHISLNNISVLQNYI